MKGFNSSDFIRKYVLLNLPYAFIFWLANKVGEAYRLAPGRDVSERVMNLQQGFSAAFESMLPSFHPQDLLVGLIGAVVIFLVVLSKKKNAKKFRRDEEHGSARWGRPADIAPFMSKNPEDNIILTQSEVLIYRGRINHRQIKQRKVSVFWVSSLRLASGELGYGLGCGINRNGIGVNYWIYFSVTGTFCTYK